MFELMRTFLGVLVFLATLQTTAIGGGSEQSQARNGFCEAYKTMHANGSSTWCSLKPARGRPCPLGLGFSLWICRNGIWVPATSKGETQK